MNACVCFYMFTCVGDGMYMYSIQCMHAIRRLSRKESEFNLHEFVSDVLLRCSEFLYFVVLCVFAGWFLDEAHVLSN